MTIVLLPYSSARVAKIARWPWVVSPEPRWISLKAKEGGCHYLDESLTQGNDRGLTPLISPRVIASPQSGYRFDLSTGKLQTVEGKPIRIITTGHSLGGGLAQHFAYAFKQPDSSTHGPTVNEVFAYDPSPVTGWFSVKDPPRTYNATGLAIHRIFEHGEILAYIRLLTSRLFISRVNPAIWQYRYNFDRNANIGTEQKGSHLVI